ncbi:MAG: DUF4397 domain-containing protein [Anaerolineae bacterium]
MTSVRWPRRLGLIAIALVMAILLVAPVAAQSDDSAQARFLHALPGAGPVDVYIDSQLTLTGLAFGAPSLYVHMPAGDHTVTVTQTGVTTPLWQQVISPTAGQSLTLIVSSTTPLEFTVFQDDIAPMPLGTARITAIHAISGGPAVDVVLADGRAVIPGLEYNTPYGTLDVPTGVYELAVVPQGETIDSALVPVTPVALDSNTSYTLVAYGTPSLPNILVLASSAQPVATSAGLRFVHAVASGSTVDVYLNDTLVAPAMAFSDSTVLLPIPEGTYDVKLLPAGEADGSPVAETSLTLDAGVVLTAVAAGSADGVTFTATPAELATPSAEVAAVELINGSTSAVSVEFAAGDQVVTADAGEIAAGAADANSSSLQVLAGETDLLTIPGPIYGGAYYTVVVSDSADGAVAFAVPPVSVATTIGSAPGTQTITTTSTAATGATLTPTPAQAEPVATEAAPAAQPTEAPVAQPTTVPASTATQPTARVLTDPGVNVHLRQYPSSAALSLALLPSGTEVTILGRPGAPTFPPDVTATPEGTPFVDPATLLTDPKEDLDPAETWLYVSLTAPDGGSVTGWINALFLTTPELNGQPVRLADLPLVPANTAGEYNSSFVPTAVPTQPFENQVVATIDQLNPGSNLHLRRNPDAGAESLALIPAGTQLVVEGVNDTGEWYQVTYNGTTGWISSTYVSLTYNGRPYNSANLQVLATPTPTQTPEPTAAS